MPHLPLPKSVILKAIKTTGFGDKALRNFADPRFEPYEMKYKLEVARAIRDANQAYASHSPRWRGLMTKAIGANKNNLVPWQLKEKFKNWCQTKAASAGRTIHDLISGKQAIGKRLASFSAVLGRTDINQPGAQLNLASVLLMAGDYSRCPPVRTNLLKDTLNLLKLDWSASHASVPERYAMFMAILDGLIDFSQAAPLKLTDRLDAQEAVWCVIDGWMDRDGKQLPGTPYSSGSIDADLAAAGAELKRVVETERTAIIAARRGQGRYRSDLISLWLGCSVTGCQNVTTLRASHLKPWRLSNNRERLDPFNGLLLTPNLDALLDDHLISFAESGGILISNSISKKDCCALGLNPQMKLGSVSARLRPYLAFHRARFNKLETAR